MKSSSSKETKEKDTNSGKQIDQVSNPGNYFTDLIWLTYPEKEQYLIKIKSLLSYLQYSDGVQKYDSNELSKLANNKNINKTVNKLAIDIEHWFLYNESKALKSVLG